MTPRWNKTKQLGAHKNTSEVPNSGNFKTALIIEMTSFQLNKIITTLDPPPSIGNHRDALTYPITMSKFY